MIGNFLGKYKNLLCKNCFGFLGQLLKIFGLLFTPTFGHTEFTCFDKNGCPDKKIVLGTSRIKDP